MLLCSYCQISKDSSDLCQQPWINLYSPKLALGYSIWLWKEKKKILLFEDFQLHPLFYYHMLPSLSGSLSSLSPEPHWCSANQTDSLSLQFTLGIVHLLSFSAMYQSTFLPSLFCLLICLLEIFGLLFLSSIFLSFFYFKARGMICIPHFTIMSQEKY